MHRLDWCGSECPRLTSVGMSPSVAHGEKEGQKRAFRLERTSGPSTARTHPPPYPNPDARLRDGIKPGLWAYTARCATLARFGVISAFERRRQGRQAASIPDGSAAAAARSEADSRRRLVHPRRTANPYLMGTPFSQARQASASVSAIGTHARRISLPVLMLWIRYPPWVDPISPALEGNGHQH